MAAQEYFDSFKQPANTRPVQTPFQANPSPASSGFSGTPPQSRRNGGGAPVSYPNPPYPTTPEPTPRRPPPYPTEPRSQQHLAPPGGPPPNVGSSYFPPQATRPSRAVPRPSDPYAYPAQAPLAMQRSTSEPPENRRVSLPSAGERRHHTPHRSSRDDSSGYDDYDDSDRSYSHSRTRSSHHQHHDQRRSSERSRSNMNTFLGAGGGALVGDAIFPGLGTLGGLLIGGWGGHEYSKRRSKSEGKYDDSRPQRPQDGKKRKESHGDGVTVRSKWGLIER